MKKALITGGAGFLGKAIKNKVEEYGYDVITFDRKKSTDPAHIQGDILNYESLQKAMHEVDVVFHIAGVLGTSELTGDNLGAVEANIKGTVNVLEAAKNQGVARVFYPTKPNEWLNTYSITKKAGEEFSRMFHELGHLDIRILRWLNAYGPQQKLTPVRKAVPMMIVEALENMPITIWGKGEQPVDLIYTDDLAKVTVEHTLNEDVGSEIYDTGLTSRLSVNDMAKLIVRLTESGSTLSHFPMRVGEYEDIPVPLLPGKSAAELLNISEQVSLEEGMLETIEYYRGLGKSARQEALSYYGELYQNVS